MHDEAEVGLVEAHAERRRGHERLDLVVAQLTLEALAVGGVGAAGVGGDAVTGLGQGSRHLLGCSHGQRVDDAAAGQLVEVGEEPAEPLLGRHRAQHAEPQ